MLSSKVALLLLLASCAVSADRLKVPSFGPAVPNVVYADGPKTGPVATETVPQTAAVSFIKRELQLTDADFVVKNVVPTKHNGMTHVYLKQVVKGVEVANGDINVNVNRDGSIFSYGSSFAPVTGAKLTTAAKSWSGNTEGTSTPLKALSTLARHLKLDLPQEGVSERPIATETLAGGSVELTGVPFARENVKAKRAYIQSADGTLIPTWQLNVPMEENWFDAHVSADGTKVVSLNDWVADASYNVIPVGKLDPTDGRTVLTDPADTTASPQGWHQTFTTTQGNNVHANIGGKFANGGAAKKFDFSLDLTKAPTAYTDAAVTNLFYMNNIMHDVFFKYGFDEVAGNFQTENYSGKGAGKDQVIANAQAPGKNNANFATPPDGQSGVMNMFTWSLTNPERDGDLENDIIQHEYGHGISNRLTGGPANSNCLGWGESGGMGEGWSDWFSLVLRMKGNETPQTDLGVGIYVYSKTIRKYMYSTSLTTNPTNYETLNQPGWSEVHSIGEIWANMLYEVYWSLMQATGKFNSNIFNPDTSAGNSLALQVVVDSLKLQPCNPTLLQARKAIADAAGKISAKAECAVWKAFAKRGLGETATTTGGKRVNSNAVPAKCNTL